MKKWLSILTVLLVLGAGSAVYAAGLGGQSSTEISVPVIGENVEMQVSPALVVETKWTGITVPFTGEPVSIYPGQTIGEGEITVTNVSPIPQAVYLYARPIRPIKIDGEVWPSFEVVAMVGGKIYRSWEPIVLAPGTKITIGFEVKVAYGSLLATFRGVELVVNTVPPPTMPWTDGKG